MGAARGYPMDFRGGSSTPGASSTFRDGTYRRIGQPSGYDQLIPRAANDNSPGAAARAAALAALRRIAPRLIPGLNLAMLAYDAFQWYTYDPFQGWNTTCDQTGSWPISFYRYGPGTVCGGLGFEPLGNWKTDELHGWQERVDVGLPGWHNVRYSAIRTDGVVPPLPLPTDVPGQTRSAPMPKPAFPEDEPYMPPYKPYEPEPYTPGKPANDPLPMPDVFPWRAIPYRTGLDNWLTDRGNNPGAKPQNGPGEPPQPPPPYEDYTKEQWWEEYWRGHTWYIRQKLRELRDQTRNNADKVDDQLLDWLFNREPFPVDLSPYQDLIAYPEPTPVSREREAVASAQVGAVTVSVLPMLRSAPSVRQASRPPGPGVKEKKLKVVAPAIAKLLMNGATESCDAIGALFQAIPLKHRLANGGTKRLPKGAEKDRKNILKKFQDVGCPQQALYVYKYLNEVNANDAVKNLIVNELVDRALGKINQKANAAYVKANRNTRVGLGFGVNF